MAVQKSKKSKSKAKSRRHAKKLAMPNVTIDPMTGEKTLRHHVTASGYYKGKKVLNIKTQSQSAETDE